MSKVLLPIIGTRTGNWIRLLASHRVPPRYWHRLVLSSLVIAAGIPFRRWEHFRFGEKIQRSNLQDPIFIIGHWRSGTTHLHNLLATDPQFGYISYLQGLFPWSFLSNDVFRRFMEWSMPEKRPMDNMKMSVRAAQECEVPLATLHGRSMYTGWYFPEKMDHYFDKWVLFKDCNRTEIEHWKRDYIFLLKSATFTFDGAPLILKSPANTARVKVLLEMFPNAKFIHIHRHPLDVFLSTRQLYDTALSYFQLQPFDSSEAEPKFIRYYRDMMKAFLSQRDEIPTENLIEFGFDDLVNDPTNVLSKVYQQFGLPGIINARHGWNEYLDKKKGYRKNRYQADSNDVKIVRENWGFAALEWGYSF